ncbi:DNA-binding protein [Meira miltonrushii]|uniref:DNA-binding protein n=1 Tax=Meira miltonrushii TaxID=1280837 RepID=A0A316VE94_9BASI|nr:DNA-binding protein [Meira miltonrushii]PWN35830.1 DNA-binding protein [Meira miltonrushii]
MASTKASTSKAVNEVITDEDDDGTQLTYNETIDALCGFIKTAVHTILCHRQVYPANVFARRQRYRVPVWSSRHPGLNAYIDDVLSAVKVQLQRNLVKSVHVVINSVASGDILERYRFDVDFILSNVPMRDRDFSIPGNMNAHTIELQLRAFMMKLVSLDGALYDLDDPDDLTWAMVLDMKEGCQPHTDDAKGNEPAQGAWVPFDESRHLGAESNEDNNQSSSNESGSRPSYLRAKRLAKDSEDDVQIVPVKSLDTGVINLMLYVEEHPTAKRQSKTKPSTAQKSTETQRRRRRRSEDQSKDAEALEDSVRAGERDLDEPLPRPSSSGAAISKASKAKRKKAVTGETTEGDQNAEDASEPSEGSNSDDVGGSSGSEDSIRSVNDFAGYGKGPGGVGMSGVGM